MMAAATHVKKATKNNIKLPVRAQGMLTFLIHRMLEIRSRP